MDFEQRANIKFCVALGKTFIETFQMLKTVWGDDVKRSTVHLWFKRFKEGRRSIEDDPKSGRPVTARDPDHIFRVRELVRADRRLSVRDLATMTGISIGTVHSILTEDLKMSRICAKFVPKILDDDQKERRKTCAQEMLEQVDNDPDFLEMVVTGDESWIYSYDPQTKMQSSQWKTRLVSPRPKKGRMEKSRTKSMLILFFDIKGVLLMEFLPQGATVNAAFYEGVLKRLREAIRQKRPEKWKNGWLLHHDNAPSHTSFKILNFLARHNITCVNHPPYSPDMAPCDFWVFPKLKANLKGERFQTIEEIQAVTKAQLRQFKPEEFRKCFETFWVKRWKNCVESDGAYFECDKVTKKFPRSL